MLGMGSELLNRIVSIVCIVVAILSLSGYFLYTSHMEELTEQRRAEMLALSAPLEYEKSQYEQELRLVESTMLETIPTGSFLSLVVLSCDEKLYTDLYPLFAATNDEYAEEGDIPLVGTVCLSNKMMPGDEGAISLAEYESLLLEGWSTAIYIDDSAAHGLESYLGKFAERVIELDIEMPKTAYFVNRNYTINHDNLLTRYGITNVFHHEESGFPFAAADTLSALWRVGTVDWNTMNIAPAALASIISSGGNGSFTFSFFEHEANSYFTGDSMAAASVDRMLDKIRESVVAGELKVKNPTEARLDYTDYLEAKAGIYIVIEQRKQELRALISDLERRIVEIYASFSYGEE